MISNIVGRDLTTNGMAIFALLFLLLLAVMNPPEEKSETDEPPPGLIMVELRWPDDIDVDIDLWVKAPNDQPVGYSNRSSKIFDLLRDDLGSRGDVMNLNYENAFSRGIVEGRYCVNVHYFRGGIPDVPISIRMTFKKKDQGQPSLIFSHKDYMRREGEELTIYCLNLDKLGRKSNLSRVYQPLRAASSRP